MAAKRYLVRAVDWLDDRLAAATLGRRRERPALLGFLFHGVFENAAEIAAELRWPAQPLQVAELSRFIEHFLAHGYRFVSPADLLAGLPPGGYYALLTFDDGYANNLKALPVLRALSVPATFFVSAGHVAEGRAFWWDVVYRERRRRGVSFGAIRREVGALRRRAPREIESWLKDNFGRDSLRPVGDTDRPFTPAELGAFASDPLVSVGNHTFNHVDLTRIDRARVAAEIGEGQQYLESLTGTAPSIVAYPDGRYDRWSIAAARAAGLRLGVTTERAKARLPFEGAAAMTVPRAFMPCGDAMPGACLRSRSDFQLRGLLERLTRRAGRRTSR